MLHRLPELVFSYFGNTELKRVNRPVLERQHHCSAAVRLCTGGQSPHGLRCNSSHCRPVFTWSHRCRSDTSISECGHRHRVHGRRGQTDDMRASGRRCRGDWHRLLHRHRHLHRRTRRRTEARISAKMTTQQPL